MSTFKVKNLREKLGKFNDYVRVNAVYESPEYANVHKLLDYNTIRFDHENRMLQFAFDVQKKFKLVEHYGLIKGILQSSIDVLYDENKKNTKNLDEYNVCGCKIENNHIVGDIMYLSNILPNNKFKSISFPKSSNFGNIIDTIFLEFSGKN